MAGGTAMVETRTIDVVPDSERHGTPRSQFTLWFGANMQITAIVDGALAVVFGADALWAIVGLTLGNILGGVDVIRRKDAILRAHCEALGRDHREIERTTGCE